MLGPSGSGKTTCLMMLAGFESSTHGEIRLDGKPIGNIPPHKRGNPTRCFNLQKESVGVSTFLGGFHFLSGFSRLMVGGFLLFEVEIRLGVSPL